MSANTPDHPVDAEQVEVATGDRPGDVHFEPDKDQLVVARHLVRPTGPLPPEEHAAGATAEANDAPPVEDVLVAPEGPSVWDARPVDRPTR
jgi:hypothetical protein